MRLPGAPSRIHHLDRFDAAGQRQHCEQRQQRDDAPGQTFPAAIGHGLGSPLGHARLNPFTIRHLRHEPARTFPRTLIAPELAIDVMAPGYHPRDDQSLAIKINNTNITRAMSSLATDRFKTICNTFQISSDFNQS